jgi:endonuclease/exonuclease/phosphatase family metal-dependent hydrolase
MSLRPFSTVIRALAIALLLVLQNGALATEISVLSYNVFMRSPTWIFRDNHDWRAEIIPQYLLGYDVVVLQEAFSKAHRLDILSTLDASYPYNSGILGDDEFLSYNGGVIVLSRWPIIRKDQVILEGCEGSDCMVKKGAVYIALEKNGETVNLFGLHLQAQKEYSETRVAQFSQIKAFI